MYRTINFNQEEKNLPKIIEEINEILIYTLTEFMLIFQTFFFFIHMTTFQSAADSRGTPGHVPLITQARDKKTTRKCLKLALH